MYYVQRVTSGGRVSRVREKKGSLVLPRAITKSLECRVNSGGPLWVFALGSGVFSEAEINNDHWDARISVRGRLKNLFFDSQRDVYVTDKRLSVLPVELIFFLNVFIYEIFFVSETSLSDPNVPSHCEISYTKYSKLSTSRCGKKSFFFSFLCTRVYFGKVVDDYTWKFVFFSTRVRANWII